ncbi:uncharacterized protein CC84DRAFT_576397 [Paraphaeosphaeria sporulosa]|uniref:Uncharacterized protein n=1 Tax=Paraphaeosphaeria sporulosa TaxID=1460663 RepID=A0A177CM66_9PLEO|nr:uncharacterized protein CC84DRAFT_576397 [Paraphaeosphaeria sporulosa]OAG08396.1 hypothetical protein CC84DRAFT_576397 [Paraphaeosphaeria sporulosa]
MVRAGVLHAAIRCFLVDCHSCNVLYTFLYAGRMLSICSSSLPCASIFSPIAGWADCGSCCSLARNRFMMYHLRHPLEVLLKPKWKNVSPW